jgi:hypothetical protein
MPRTMSLHVHIPRGITLRKRERCPFCERVTRFVVIVFEWYEPTSYCCACGERWEGAERAQRPFERGWRKRSIEQARALWKQAAPARAASRELRARFPA